MRLVVATSIVALFATSAMAADAIVEEPVPVAVDTFSWTGGYIGINAGYAGGKFKHPFSLNYENEYARSAYAYGIDGSLDITSSGFVGGVQVGYNWQFDNGLILGAEADFQGSTVKGKISADLSDGTYSINASAETKVDWFGTVRARLGYAATERFMVYGTGGLAYGHVKSSLKAGYDGFGIDASHSKTKLGWTIGAGAEYAITNNWTFKTEYLYTDLGKTTLINISGEDGSFDLKNDVKFHTVRVGLNYKF